MALKLSTGTRVGLAVTGSLRSLLNGSTIKIYGGTVPASADDDIGSATLLCTVSVGGDGTGVTFESTAPGGVLTKTAAETWQGTNVASGTATFFRISPPSDPGTASSTVVRGQGTVGVLAADMELASVELTNGAPLAINSAAFTIPASA